ncbi:YdbH family protein [Citrobacter amalonaticus]|uniref:YdbH family protein n=1 Tax=Citrobacter amalonaticus TaxID=35703 RepID=A0A2S4S1B4_CITAM|nr:YdbH family protein [Citrobacter amalonaticus]POT55213.1 YdbH family protein [Citrobacter amalonaticus]POT77179.1 YdbH family protein [Citrobacter amalonaticus]POU67630.1 YdbH family protein [Citrobacter amalonaticus]POV07235.1 YdbH family protein [Citrobacter amalonaticus]
MKGKYTAVLALLLLLILMPLTLLMTLGQWIPMLAGIWLPVGTRIALEESPRITPRGLHIPQLQYLIGDCQLARVTQADLSHPSRWLLNVGTVELDSACLAKLPQTEPSLAAPKTLAQWQSMLPNTWIHIDKLVLSPWQEWQGKLSLSLTPAIQQLSYQGEKVNFQGRLRGQNFTVSEFNVAAFEGQPPVKLVGDFTLPLVPDGLPVSGHAVATLSLPQEPSLVDAELAWQDNAGQLIVMARDNVDPLLDLPWKITQQQLTISDGRWTWPYQGLPLSGRLGIKVDNWQEGTEKAIISGRLNVLTQGVAGKGNAVLNFGPGKLSMDNSEMPLQLTGEAKDADLVFYARLPARLTGSLVDPTLAFEPGALLRSRGRVIDSLDIDEIRWPLAGVKVTQRGVDGRLQAILRAHENKMGDFVLHLDGQANDFLPDAGRWEWRYWGTGGFTPMHTRWDVAGTGEWHDNTITLTDLSTGFDQLQYGSMKVDAPRLVLDEPIVWLRDAEHPKFSGALSLDAGNTLFTGGSVLPPSTLKFSVDGSDPTLFQFKGNLHAGAIGPIQLNGRWDGIRLRGQAWWPKQSLSVFQPLVPPDWKMNLREGQLYAQVAFSAAQDQGFEAGGHGVLKGGSAWMPDNQINGVDFVLPFRFSDGAWQLGTRGPVSLRIAEVVNQVTARNITADLQGRYPWSEETPLLLTDVSVDVLGGKVIMQQLRMPQHDPALLRVQNISSSELISAVNPKQFAMSGPVSGALPLWLNNEKWIIKDGWLTNPGPMTLRIDKDTADAVVKDNMAAGAAINWLRYMEIAHSWTKINLDNLGVLTMQATIGGNSHVDGKVGTVNLNYTHEENVFTLWRSLRFGDNLQAWLEQNTSLPETRCLEGKECEDPQ